MPLSRGKSKVAFEHNVKAEMNAGKPQKQALAIAYATKRRKMAHGGMIDEEPQEHIDDSFLSDEDALESPFQEAADDPMQSDEAELDEHNALDEPNEVSLDSIMKKVRKLHRGM